MQPFPLGPLTESQSRVRQEFLDFVEQWQQTKQQWRDEPARKFEREALCDLSPTLTRVSAAMQTFAEACREADHHLSDPDRYHGA
ncbi:MAG: hypothetical protein ACF787_03325 [Rhodopirellula sp. JB053]|uniref:hypothetical protein n=1 Tax=Rhodopirellula sp. JB044 TaxID=3342844 RepID=UPI00370CDC31